MRLLYFVSLSLALTTHVYSEPSKFGVLTDPQLLGQLGVSPMAQSKKAPVAYAELTELEILEISKLAHTFGRCAGFQLLGPPNPSIIEYRNQLLKNLDQIHSLNKIYEIRATITPLEVTAQSEISNILTQVDSASLEAWVKWFSSFPSRYHKGPKKNEFVSDFKKRLQTLIPESRTDLSIIEIPHTKTPQKSLRLRFMGSERPNEIVVLGAHMDSILGWGFDGPAPGADDNASGSSNLVEAARLLIEAEFKPKRTIDFFWYAGEEGGLLGSSEIAAVYAKAKNDVVGALQLDMTAHPGDGPLNIVSIEDFTHPGLRNYLKKLNETYVGANLQEGETCGYACSDHASWTSVGYPAVFPFEASTQNMNSRIHTRNDVIGDHLNFEHSNVFTKLAIAYAADLSQSLFRP